MKITRPKHLFQGERVVAVDPPFATYVSERWNRRLNYYTGRTLTHTALNVEQHNHSSHLTLYGGQLSRGVVQGLSLSLKKALVKEPAPEDTLLIAEQRFLIEPGSGLGSKGEDITLSQPMLVPTETLPVIGQASDDKSPPRGIGVVLLQPIVAESAGEFDDTDPCEIDPSNDAFEDWQIADGLRVAWYPWPSSWALPLPPFTQRLRNRVSYIIYEQERNANGEPLPWEKVGVALALVRILADGSIDFIDRHAVVRQGGVPNPRRALIPGNGSPFLWQAQILGLTAHMQELRGMGLDLKEAINYFQYLPPVGVLPPDIVDFTSNQGQFLPSQYTINAAPIPLEQFEVVVEAAASAEPFDLYVPDQIKVLVPVPQAFYEPRLLKREVVDPIFEQTIADLLQELGGVLGKRGELRVMAASVMGAMDKELIPQYPAEDPEAVPGETPNDNYTIDIQHDELARTELHDLYSWLEVNSPLSSTEIDKINPEGLGSDDFAGVQQLIDDLQEKVNTSNNKIDFGFLRVQTDIYRMRQMMLGSVEATRLATSPVLANIAKGDSSYATQQNLKDYFAASFVPMAATAETGGATAAVLTHGITTGGGGGGGGSGSSGGLETVRMMRIDTGDVRFAAGSTEDTASAGRRTVSAPLFAMMAASGGETASDASAGFSMPVMEAYVPSSEDVEQQSPIVGETLEFRSTTVAERIAEPPGPEARSYAVSTKASIYSELADLPINLDGIEVPLAGNESAVVSRSDYNDWLKNLGPSDGETAVMSTRAKTTEIDVVVYLGPFTDRERKLLGDREAHLRTNLNVFIGTNKRALTMPGLSGLILSGFYDPHPTDGDESAFLSVGVSALESAVTTLRRIERRINGYKLALSRCKKTLAALQKIADGWDSDVADTQDKIREHRHDITVARALLQEEQNRVNSINQRRQEILKNHVSFIGYMRPRLVSLRKDMPSVQVHGEFVDPVPACLKQDLPLPDELGDMLDLFRDVPLNWLPYSKLFIYKLDTFNVLKSVFKSAKQKAVLQLAATEAVATTQAQAAGTRYAMAINNVVSARKQSYFAFTQKKAAYNLQLLEAMTWKQASEKAQDELSLQDLIEAGRGKSGLAQHAARELENIQDVAVCLYGRCGEVPPAQRLLWADQLSEFDQPVSLKNLEVLPQWDQLDFDLRRDLQRLNSWLFSRIDTQIPDAVSLMNDLVRVCILLASHAPVSSIINGHVPEPATGKIGDIIHLAIDKGLVRVGMQVGIYSGVTMSVQGVVEDMTAEQATIKVTQTKDATFHLDKGSKAQFYHANAVLGLLM